MQLGRLRQVHEIVDKHLLGGVEQAVGQCPLGRGGARRFVPAVRHAEQAAHQRLDRALARADTEVEDDAFVTRKSLVRGEGFQFLD